MLFSLLTKLTPFLNVTEKPVTFIMTKYLKLSHRYFLVTHLSIFFMWMVKWLGDRKAWGMDVCRGEWDSGGQGGPELSS